MNLNGLRLLRVEYDPYERETEEDEEYDFDYEPDPVEVLIRVRAALRSITMEAVLCNCAHRGLRPPRRPSTSRSSIKRGSKLEERCSGLSTATTLSSSARISSPCLTTTRVSRVFLSLSDLRRLTRVPPSVLP